MGGGAGDHWCSSDGWLAALHRRKFERNGRGLCIFVAEYTGQATVIVPSLLAMTTVRLIVGNRSVSPGQHAS